MRITLKDKVVFIKSTPAIITYCMAILASSALLAKPITGINTYFYTFLALLGCVSLISLLNFFFYRLTISKIINELNQSLVAVSEKNKRHLFVPDSASKIPTAIKFHFEQLILENEHLSSEIQEIQAIYNSILNTQDELVFIIDKDGYISYRNRAFDDIFGTPSLDFDEETSIFSENLSFLMQQISPFISYSDSNEKQNHLLTKIDINNRTRHIIWAINQLSNLEPMRVLFVGRDETEEVEIRRRNEHLQKIATVGRAASTIFHEINQPLSIINLSTFMIKNTLESVEYQLSDDLKNELSMNANIIESQINRSNQIIKNLRLFHSGDKKRKVIEPVSVDNLITESLAMMEKEIHENAIHLTTRLHHPENTILTGNETLFTQVLVNILKNSIQALASSECLKNREITVSSTIHGNSVSIVIEDNGPGIPENELPQATEPFFTTKDEGSGLGLALCLDILNSYNGSLNIKNCQPHGLLTTVCLPLAEQTPRQDRQ